MERPAALYEKYEQRANSFRVGSFVTSLITGGEIYAIAEFASQGRIGPAVILGGTAAISGGIAWDLSSRALNSSRAAGVAKTAQTKTEVDYTITRQYWVNIVQ